MSCSITGTVLIVFLASSAYAVRLVKRREKRAANSHDLGSSISYHLAQSGGNDCGDGASPTQSNCEAQADALTGGHHQGRQSLVIGSWGHVPFGCSLQSGGDWAAHYNFYPSGRNDGGYSLVCSKRERGYSFRLAARGSNDCGDGASPTESNCEAQADALAGGHHQGRQHLVIGSWGHVPFGCSLQSHGSQACGWQCYLDRYPDLQAAFGRTNTEAAKTHYYKHGTAERRDCTCQAGDWAAHYNLNSGGRNDGAYSLVCSKRDAHLEAALHKTSGWYAFLWWNNGMFGTTGWDAHWKVEAPHDNVIGHFGSHHSNHYEDRQFTIGYGSLWPGELLWSRWTGWVNGWDGHAKGECKPLEVLTGIESIHSNHHEDRLWKIRCSRVLADNEGKRWWSDWQNGWDQAFSNPLMGQAQLMVGIESYHNNHHEDRRFRFAFSSFTGFSR